MHYKNGREAKNGDKVVLTAATAWDAQGKPIAFTTTVGILYDAQPGNDHCNGELVITGYGPQGPAIIIGACMCDCLHVDDVAVILAEKGLDKRPAGK